jgi:hypothetical protein
MKPSAGLVMRDFMAMIHSCGLRSVGKLEGDRSSIGVLFHSERALLGWCLPGVIAIAETMMASSLSPTG